MGGGPAGPAPTYGAPLYTNSRLPSRCILRPPHSPQLGDMSRFYNGPSCSRNKALATGRVSRPSPFPSPVTPGSWGPAAHRRDDDSCACGGMLPPAEGDVPCTKRRLYGCGRK